jgi:hypothetical protein
MAHEWLHSETSQKFTETHSMCCDCLELLPKENFTPDPQKNSGVACRCGKCLAIYRKKKAEELGEPYQGVVPQDQKVKKDKTWYDDTHAECLEEGCGIHSRDSFYPVEGNKRGCNGYCKEHYNKNQKEKRTNTSEEEKEEISMKKFKKRASRLIETTYKSYKRKRRENTERFGESPEVDMTLEEFAELWPEDNRCPYYHNFLEIKRGGRTCDSPSIDRIDNDKGYTKDNIEIVCWLYNSDKGTMNIQRQFAHGGVAAKKLGYRWPPEVAN